MSLPLMPKATAVWLVENTALTFEQIADFTGMHELEIQAIADGEVAQGIVGLDPVANGQLTADNIKACEANPEGKLKLARTDNPRPQTRAKGARYTPVSKRQDRPDAIAWLLKHHPELTDAQLCKLIGTTKPTLNAIRDKTHWNAANLKPRNPVTLGLCSEADLEKMVALSPRRHTIAEPDEPAAPVEEAPAEEISPRDGPAPDAASVFGGPVWSSASDDDAGSDDPETKDG
ncbi:DUF1013 domain-containing protein [Roseospirillum parvum]|uniref:Cytoplasmic protein n=1 Tax=Roseospirillum parvum TaxID=83401 RepID=A0A1G7WB73_9PROT|nr:cell cycle transcriptional regulator TrcR [Roseospirillum parvum]SDG69257.1 hypothetical protein SAMN05421742_102138 [Roseospirillum parvum]